MVSRIHTFAKLGQRHTLFESRDGYIYPPSVPSTTTALQTLHRLLSPSLTASDYHTARRILLDLASLQTRIPHSPAFLFPATYALSLPTASQQLSDFTLWFTYYPTRRQNPSKYPKFSGLLRSAHLTLYPSLALFLARKGYSGYVNNFILPSLARYTPPSDFVSFFAEYRAKIRGYDARQAALQSRFARTAAMRYLSDAGHVAEALALAPPVVIKRRGKGETTTVVIGKSTSLSKTLWRLSRALCSPNPKHFPRTNELVEFFISYISHRSDRLPPKNALSLLHTHTLRFSPISLRALSHLLFAHLVLLFRLGTHPNPIQSTLPPIGPPALISLLSLFNTFFHPQGIPQSHLHSHLQHPQSPSSSYLQTLLALSPSHLPPLFPTRLHISLIWQSLAHLAPSPDVLSLLYDELVSFASGNPNGQSLVTPPSWTPTTPSSSTHPLPSPIISECFTPFLIPLLRSPSSSHTPTSILRTLLSLRLSPTIHHYTEFARYWAYNAQEDNVWLVLDRLESEHGQMSGVEKDQKLLRELESASPQRPPPASPQPRPGSHPHLPAPDLPLYIALMRAFLSSPNYHSRSSSLPIITPPSLPTSPPSPYTPPFPPSSPYPGTHRRLLALSHLWSRMERRFGREWLLGQLDSRSYSSSEPNPDSSPTSTSNPNPNPNAYLQKVIVDWYSLASASSSSTSSSSSA
ncbi:hypothetical protein EV360DRAFT_88944 [Lentinula raphanica]|nr:hypothetical protein EV360DRAFT_88944 [Lentinula raphanica]